MTTSNIGTDVLLSEYQRSVASYWNNTSPTGSRGASRQDDVNRLLGEIDGLYHHHYGVGPVTSPGSRARRRHATGGFWPSSIGWRPPRPTSCSTTSAT
jgi:hypothetical protein